MALDFTKNSEIGSFFAHFYELIENESLLDRIRQSQDASEVMEVLNEIGLTAGPPTLPQEENLIYIKVLQTSSKKRKSKLCHT